MATNLYTAIREAWAQVGPEPWNQPPHLQGPENEARKLDKRFSDAIDPFILQYQDGLISAVELFDKMMVEAVVEV